MKKASSLQTSSICPCLSRFWESTRSDSFLFCERSREIWYDIHQIRSPPQTSNGMRVR